ncbi:MAG: class I SAM-dependent methyltransferase [Parachlamydiaceae bacterium]|nr:class I SAM-dependent methyltransferase [Parachlamydiaceae bacterium]
MVKSRLNIVAVTPPEAISPGKVKRNHKEEARAKFERLWLVDPEQFNPNRNAIERERVTRTLNIMQPVFNPKDKKIVDLGCGSGVFTNYLADRGASVDAVDIASNALKTIQPKANINLIQDYVPHTKLKDEAYDVVLGTEIIAYLHADLYRLFFSELARLTHNQGHVVCSTPLDIYAEDALERFVTLVETEFKVDKWQFSYHAWYIRLRRILHAPDRFSHAMNSPDYRQKQLNKRKGIRKHWFLFNSTKGIGFIWTGLNKLLKPTMQWLEQSSKLLLWMEKCCRFISSESGISHVIFVGTRRSMIDHLPADEIPQERKHRKEVWE